MLALCHSKACLLGRSVPYHPTKQETLLKEQLHLAILFSPNSSGIQQGQHVFPTGTYTHIKTELNACSPSWWGEFRLELLPANCRVLFTNQMLVGQSVSLSFSLEHHCFCQFCHSYSQKLSWWHIFSFQYSLNENLTCILFTSSTSLWFVNILYWLHVPRTDASNSLINDVISFLHTHFIVSLILKDLSCILFQDMKKNI